MSSPMHEEQHLRRSARKTRPQTGAVCRAEAWRWVLGFGDWLILGFRPRQAPGQRQRESGWPRGRRVVFTCGRYFLQELIRLGEGKCSVPGECRGARKMTPNTTPPPPPQAHKNSPYLHLVQHFSIFTMKHASYLQ